MIKILRLSILVLLVCFIAIVAGAVLSQQAISILAYLLAVVMVGILAWFVAGK